MEIYEETKSMIRIDKKYGRGFWTTKGLRQRCPLRPLLFNMIIGDIEKA